MINFLVEQAPFSIILLLTLALADYYLTALGAKIHQASTVRHVTYRNGYELNPVFEKGVAQYRWFTYQA